MNDILGGPVNRSPTCVVQAPVSIPPLSHGKNRSMGLNWRKKTLVDFLAEYSGDVKLDTDATD
jgi:hypothetical protein